MKRTKDLLLTLLLLFCTTIQVSGQTSSNNYLIIGYFRLGMSYSEFSDQCDKIRQETEVDYNGIPINMISIGGYQFSLFSFATKNTVDVNRYISEVYDRKYDPSVFSNGTYFITENHGDEYESKLAAISISSLRNLSDGNVYMPTSLKDYNHLSVENVKRHNELVDMVDSLASYLSNKKFGKANYAFKIPRMPKSNKPAMENPINATLMYQIMNYGTSTIISKSLMPKMIWNRGDEQIILGIEESGVVTLSFIDTKALSHENIDRMFPKETPKSKVSW